MTDKADEKGGLRANRRVFLQGAAVVAAAVPVAAKAETLVRPTNHQIGARYQASERNERFYALNRR